MKTTRFFSIIVLVATCSQLAAVAEDPYTKLPFSNASYYHFARNQNLAELIKDFFAMQGMTVIVSGKIDRIVNGRFSKMDPVEFWNYITKAYGLVWFFDGKIMFVYPSSELHTQIFRMDLDSIETLSVILSRLEFATSDFSFRGIGEANVLIVTAPPQYLSVINDIAAKFVPSKISDTTIVKIIPLKYAWAYDMTFNYANGSISVPGISSMLQSIISGQRSEGVFSPFNVNVGGAQKPESQQMIGIHDDTPQYAKDINNSIKKIQARDGSSGTADGKKGESGEGIPGEKSVDISGTTLPGFITCDQRLNAVIIRDRRENIPFYEEIIATLDVPCEVIKIDAAVVDVNKNSEMAIGLNSIKVSGTAPNSSWSIKFRTDPKNSDATGTIVGSTGIIRNVPIEIALDAIEKSGNGQTMSKPSVLTLDNVAAILETSKVHYTTVSGANSSNAYTQTATTKLQVVPHIIPGDVDNNGRRKMKLFVDISDGSFESVAGGAVTQHSLNTQAVLYEGQSLMIGGYNTEVNSTSNGGVPLLKDIPIVGVLFKHAGKEKTVKERVYVISPTVVEIRSDDHTYDRFLQPGELTADPTLASDEYKLPTKWPKETKQLTERIRKR
ncbi:MAG: hypothetical protein LBR91_01870 [Puniceicoccales bacterium]|jgi:type III secretion protein C|nr:hypothetical protein [Puniceicoccales bacterium]